MQGTTYICELELLNPNGLNNFKNFDGIHIETMTDSDVKKIIPNAEPDSTNFPSIICEKFENLQEVLMQYSGKIRSIDDYSFKNCRNLTSANFYGHLISQVNENAFIENTKLQKLYLYKNNLSSLPENVFKNQQNLQVLWMDNNNITDLPLNIFKSLNNLKDLNLRINQLSTLKVEWFASLKNLIYLDLQQNQIEVLPANVFGNLEKLTYLYMTSNNLKIINSNSFGNFQTLACATFGYNQISAIDEQFIEKAALTRLLMQTNLCSNITAIKYSKTTLKQYLTPCFDNFEALMASEYFIIT